VRQPAAIDLNVLVNDTTRLVRRLLGEQIEVTFHPDPQLGVVWADPSQIEQIVVNLAVNGRDAMPRGGTLSIETANVELSHEYAGFHMSVVPGPYVMLAVRDTGEGMDAATQTHIFEPFFTTKVPGKGTGLGLATIYSIVKQSRGNIWVYSEPGYGTMFKVYFPRVPVPGATAATADPEPGVIRGAGRVLVVEDDLAVRTLVAKILKRAGYQPIVTPGPTEALVLARDPGTTIDLVLTDVVMPVMSGRELAALIREVRPTLPVAFMSGYTNGSLEERDLLERDAVLIAKPFSPKSLTQGLAAALAPPGAT
jgi:CheY-like chemotaxis protein